MDRKTSLRNVYSRLTSSMKGISADTMAASDTMVDEALALLENEEPGLLSWMQSPEIDSLLGSHTVAMYALLTGDHQRGYNFDYTMGRVDALNYRLVCTLAVMATMRERPLAKEGYGHGR